MGMKVFEGFEFDGFYKLSRKIKLLLSLIWVLGSSSLLRNIEEFDMGSGLR